LPEQVRILFEQGKVIKRFVDPAAFERELHIYQKKPEFAPALLDHNHRDELVIAYLPHPVLGELEKPEFTAIGPLFYALHHLEGEVICHRDNNPRNYLQSPRRTWMIDFANWEYGRPEEDLIHFLLFWVPTSAPEVFSTILTQVLSGYPGLAAIEPEAWREAFERMTRVFDERRSRFGKYSPVGNTGVNRSLLSQYLPT